MVHPSLIEARLTSIGFRASRWFGAEIRELEQLLMDDEEVISLACGRYYGSFALLVATDKRLLLVDKRVFFTTVQDTRYDMMAEIDYNTQMLGSTVTIHTMNKVHKFSSIKYKRELRELTAYVQRRVWEFRQQQSVSGQMPELITNSLPQPRQPLPQPAALYLDNMPAVPVRRALASQVAQAAHKLGPAATRAAHGSFGQSARLSAYTQGSLITHRPVGSSLDY